MPAHLSLAFPLFLFAPVKRSKAVSLWARGTDSAIQPPVQITSVTRRGCSHGSSSRFRGSAKDERITGGGSEEENNGGMAKADNEKWRQHLAWPAGARHDVAPKHGEKAIEN